MIKSLRLHCFRIKFCVTFEGVQQLWYFARGLKCAIARAVQKVSIEGGGNPTINLIQSAVRMPWTANIDESFHSMQLRTILCLLTQKSPKSIMMTRLKEGTVLLSGTVTMHTPSDLSHMLGWSTAFHPLYSLEQKMAGSA